MTPERWILPLRTLTPAFVGGADPNDQAEIRVSSVRGALRAWYRLVVGPGVAAGLSEEHRELAEDRLFGGTAPGSGQGAVGLSLAEAAPEGSMPWSNREIRGSRPGLAYLGFSLDMGNNDRKAVPPATPFTLHVTLPRGLSDRPRSLLGATLWAWLTLGGLGSRSRRGFGSLGPSGSLRGSNPWGEPIPLPDVLQKWPAPADFHGLAAAVDRGLGAIRKTRRDAGIGPEELLLGRGPRGPQGEHVDPCYVLLAEDAAVGSGLPWPRSRVIVWAGPTRTGFASASDALDEFGRRFAELRRTRGIDGLRSGALVMLQHGERLERAPRRAAFGLPLALKPVGKGGGPGFELLPYVPVGGGGRRGGTTETEHFTGGRAPSPLLVSVGAMGSRYAVLLTLLSGPWPGRDLALRERKQLAGYIPADPDNQLPTELFGKLERAMEVPL